MIEVTGVFFGMLNLECDGKCNSVLRAWQCNSSILAKSKWRDAKSVAKGAGKSLVILESSLESDLQHGRARRQQQPCATIQPEPSLVCA